MTEFTLMGPIERVENIAVNHGIRGRRRLVEKYGEGRWFKRKGIATVQMADGTIERAELHWYEANGIGRKDLKHKHTLFQFSSPVE